MTITTTANNQSFTIPTAGTGYSYDVDWGNGNTSTAQTTSVSNTYATAGTYYVAITGTFPRIYFNNQGDALKVSSIEQWGDIEWNNFQEAFEGCQNMVYNATDAPDLSGVTEMLFAFSGCPNFAPTDLNNWNVSTITGWARAFANSTNFNADISTWDVPKRNVQSTLEQLGASWK